MHDTDCVVSIDVGGTRIKSALVTKNGRVLYNKQRKTLPTRNAEEIIGDINDLINWCEKKGVDNGLSIYGIGIITPGYPDKDGRVSIIPNIPPLADVPIRNFLKVKRNIPVLFENDGNAGAFGEYIFGQRKKFRHLVVLTLGTGLGSGVVIDGKIVKEKNTISGELGHITVNPEGPQCPCGKNGCLEAYFCGSSIKRMAREFAQKEHESSLTKYDPEELDPQIIAAEARDGDRTSRFIWETSAHWLGIGISVLINVFNPDKLVLAGGLLEASDLFFQGMYDETKKHVHPQFAQDFIIEVSKYRDNLGIMGAASLFHT
jgi:glucokinase